MPGTRRKVVSLLPAATDTLNAIVQRCGRSERLAFELCGCSHECEVVTRSGSGLDYLGVRAGDGAEGVGPVRLTRSRIGDIPVDEIEMAFSSSVAAVQEFKTLGEPLAIPLLQYGLSAYELDIDELRTVRPDVIITCLQTAHSCILEGELAEYAFESVLGYVPHVVHAESQSLEGVYRDMVRISEAVGMAAHGVALVKDMREEMERIGMISRQSVRSGGNMRPARTSMSVIWWSAPVLHATAWVTDMLEMLGVRNVADDWESADVVVWSLCGLGIDAAEQEARKWMVRGQRTRSTSFDAANTARRETLIDMRRESSDNTLSDLRMQGRRRAAVMDGIRLLSRPGPLLLQSMRSLAEILVGTGLERQAEEDATCSGTACWRWLA